MKWAAKFSDHTITRMILHLVIAVTAVIGLYNIHLTTEHATCQAQYNQINNARTRALNDASTTDREALVAVIQAQGHLWDVAVAHPSIPGQAPNTAVIDAFSAMRMATSNYLTAHDTLNQQLAEHPVPPPPSDLCS